MNLLEDNFSLPSHLLQKRIDKFVKMLVKVIKENEMKRNAEILPKQKVGRTTMGVKTFEILQGYTDCRLVRTRIYLLK